MRIRDRSTSSASNTTNAQGSERQRNFSCVTVDVSRRSQNQFPQPHAVRVFCVDEREDVSGSDEDEEDLFCRTEAQEVADEYLSGAARQENLAFILAEAHLMSIVAWDERAEAEGDLSL